MRRLFVLNPAMVDITIFDRHGFLGKDDVHAVIVLIGIKTPGNRFTVSFVCD